MSFWDGTRWLPEAPAPPRASGRSSRLVGAVAEASLVTALVFGLVAGSALAAKGGHGNHNTAAVVACTVDGNTVSAAGLPTTEVVNFMVTDANGTWGWVLGFSDTGTMWTSVPTPSGPTTYEFASRTYGPGGAKYTTFASCAV